jgi:hypothetical protein
VTLWSAGPAKDHPIVAGEQAVMFVWSEKRKVGEGRADGEVVSVGEVAVGVP